MKAAKRKTVESRPEEPGLEAIVVAPRRVIRFYKDKTANETERASHRGKVCEVKRSKKPLSQDNRNRLTCIVCVCVCVCVCVWGWEEEAWLVGERGASL